MALKHHPILINKTLISRILPFLPLFLFVIFGESAYSQKIKLNIPEYFPYELKADQEMGLMLTGTGLLYGSAWSQMRKQEWGKTPISRLNSKDIWFPDRPSINNWRPGLNQLREFFEPATSLVSLGLIGSYGLISNIQKKNWSDLMTLTLMYFEGLYISTGSELIIKSVVNRARPYAYNKDLPLAERIRPGNNESFFSGNATLLFYNASFISLLAFDMFPDERWTAYVIGGSFAIAELCAIWSVRSGMHFPTDVLTGALWGSGSALFINRLHRKGARGLNIMPWAIKQGKGLAIRYLIQ